MPVQVFTYQRAGAVVVDGGKVLLISMQPPGQPRWWHFPGGGVEAGETPREAAIRELFEETGLRATGATEVLRAGVHGGYHHYFLMTCDDLEIGAVSGPELEYAADADFKAEWIPIADLPRMPVWPRCVAELIAEPLPTSAGAVPYVEDDRQSWDGIANAEAPTNLRATVHLVVFGDAERHHVAAIARDHGDGGRLTLPAGTIGPGEAPADAARRVARDELGLEIRAGATFAVVVLRRPPKVSLQTYVEGTLTGATPDEERRPDPHWLAADDLPTTLRPAWLADRLPEWARHRPSRPERFCELHDE